MFYFGTPVRHNDSRCAIIIDAFKLKKVIEFDSLRIVICCSDISPVIDGKRSPIS